MKKKVLFVNPSLRQGGVEHSLITALNELDPSKYDVTLFLYADMLDLLDLVPNYVNVIVGTDKTKYFRKPYVFCLWLLYEVLSRLRCRSTAKKIQKHMYDYIHTLKINNPYKKFFKGEKFDVAVSYSLHIGTEMTLNINAGRYCVFLHSSDPSYHYETAEKTFEKYDQIVCVSNGVKEVYKAVFEKYSDKMTVIENFVNAKKVIAKSTESLQINNRTELMLCTCGRFSAEKGFDMAIESAYLLKQQGINFVWYFVGDGDERQKMEKLISKYSLKNDIVITGYVENPFPYVKACDIYVQPSYQESFGLTIKEAVILNKTIVCTDTVGGRTVLGKGKYGETVPISAEEIAKGILTAQKKAQMGIYEKYDINQNEIEKKEYKNLLEQMLDRS